MTRTEAIDQILGIFKTAWDTTPYATRVFYDNVSNAEIPPTGRLPWARVSVRHIEGNQATLAGVIGERRFRRSGFVNISIFQPAGGGLPGSLDLPTIVRDAYEGVSTPNGAWFRNVRINEVGVDGEWFVTNVIADFSYDEIR